MRLLVVEDESLLRQQLEQGLSNQGFVVDVAEDGKAGLYFSTEYAMTLPLSTWDCRR